MISPLPECRVMEITQRMLSNTALTAQNGQSLGNFLFELAKDRYPELCEKYKRNPRNFYPTRFNATALTSYPAAMLPNHMFGLYIGESSIPLALISTNLEGQSTSKSFKIKKIYDLQPQEEASFSPQELQEMAKTAFTHYHSQLSAKGKLALTFCFSDTPEVAPSSRGR